MFGTSENFHSKNDGLKDFLPPADRDEHTKKQIGEIRTAFFGEYRNKMLCISSILNYKWLSDRVNEMAAAKKSTVARHSSLTFTVDIA